MSADYPPKLTACQAVGRLPSLSLSWLPDNISPHGFWIVLGNHQCLVFNLLLLWQRSFPDCRVVSIQQCMFYLKLYSFLSRRVFQGLPMKHYKSSSVPTHQCQASYTCDAFVQPSVTGVFVGWAYRGLTDLQSTWENVWLKILFAVHINRVNTPRSPLWTKNKKKHDNEKVVLSFLLIDLDQILDHQEQISRSYQIHISFLVAWVQAGAYKENHVSREHEMQKVRCK